MSQRAAWEPERAMTNTTPAPLLVTLTDAAHMLALSRRTLDRMVYSGRLPSVTIGRRRLIRVADLSRLARTGCASPVTEPPEAQS